MSGTIPIPTKKPKLEEDVAIIEDEEANLLALMNHRIKEIQHIRDRISYYRSELDGARKRLEDTKHQLVRLQGEKKENVNAAPSSENVNVERESTSPLHLNIASRNKAFGRTKLVIPCVQPKISPPPKSAGPARNNDFIPSPRTRDGGAKRKFEQKEVKELTPLIGKASSPRTIRCHPPVYIPSQHPRKLRNLALCPTNDHLFVTSALDGKIRLWEINASGSYASPLCFENCSTQGARWPEDLTWHPNGDSVFSAYTADSGNSQVSILNLNKKGKDSVTFLEDKPHIRGDINSIRFMPWEDDTCFVTGGTDHAVILWNEKDTRGKWKPMTLHQNLHTSTVTGIAGMQRKNSVLSVGADKRIIGYDIDAGNAYFKHWIESKCLNVSLNPCNSNIFVVQAGVHEKQLRLFDIRLSQPVVHYFGWKPESSETHTALIKQSWSPDGLYLTSGSTDPMIHIFDIRYDSHEASQSIKAHQSRVFKAEWHPSLPLLISISSDLNVGLHKINAS